VPSAELGHARAGQPEFHQAAAETENQMRRRWREKALEALSNHEYTTTAKVRGRRKRIFAGANVCQIVAGGGSGDMQVLELVGSYASDEGKVDVMSGVNRASLRALLSQWKKGNKLQTAKTQ